MRKNISFLLIIMFVKIQSMQLIPQKLLGWQVKQDSNECVLTRLSYDSLSEVYFHYLEVICNSEEQELSIKADIALLIKQYGSKQSIFYFYELKSLIEKTNTFIPISINPKALDIVDFISIRLQKKTNFSEAFEDAVVTFYINRKSEQKIELTDCDVKLLTSYQIRAAAPPIQVIVRTYFLDRIKHVYTTLWNLPKNENKNALFVAFAPLAVVALIFFPTLRKNFVNNLTPEEQFKIIGGFFAFLFYLYKAPKTKTVTL